MKIVRVFHQNISFLFLGKIASHLEHLSELNEMKLLRHFTDIVFWIQASIFQIFCPDSTIIYRCVWLFFGANHAITAGTIFYSKLSQAT